MEINCALIITRSAEEDHPLPQWVFFYVDPEWEGKWVQRNATTRPFKNSAIFLVKYTMNPLKKIKADAPEINSTVKVQFFLPPKRDTPSPDFQFSSFFPLKVLLPPRSADHFGLWNGTSHYCDTYRGGFLPHYTLTVQPLGPEPEAPLLPLSIRKHKLLSPQTHTNCILLAKWLKEALVELFPTEPSGFTYMRTFMRNPWTDTFFFDLHKLLEPESSNLPPPMALYILVNALILHGMDMDKLLATLDRNKGRFQSKEEVTRFLAMARDILMFFTLCLKEGAYREDMCNGKETQDQMYPFVLRIPDKKNFEKATDEDDCEGRSAQGCIHVPLLFRKIAKESKGEDDLRRFKAPFLQVSDAQYRTLLRIAVHIGEMFEDGRLKTHMCIGDCSILSFNSVDVFNGATMQQQGEDLGGHAFGLLLYSADGLQGSIMLETTGYEGKEPSFEVLPPHIALLMAQDMREAVAAAEQDQNHVNLRVSLTPESEDRLFVKAYSGDNALFFSQKGGVLEYGAKPSMLDAKVMQYEVGQSREEVRSWGDCAILMTPETFFKSLVKTKGLWQRALPNADAMLSMYQEFLAQYPSFNKSNMPPPESEAKLLQCMIDHWGVITAKDLKSPLPGQVVVSMLEEEGVAAPLVLQNTKGKVKSHAFLGSRIYRINYSNLGG